jgi:transposase
MNAPLGAAPERIWLAVEAVDMRLGIDGLSARIQASLGRTPCDGTAYAFTNRRRSRLKLLVWDGTGVWLSQRRLHRGYFTWPSASDPVFALTAAQWRWRIVFGIRCELPPALLECTAFRERRLGVIVVIASIGQRTARGGRTSGGPSPWCGP